MNDLINLMTVIGVDRTLIIACGQYAMYDYIEISDNVALFVLPDNMLRQYDSREKEQLQRILDKHRCTQVVILGLLDEEMKWQLAFQSNLHTLRAGLRFRDALLPKGDRVITTTMRYQTLLEQHVATQCSYLMEYHFVGKQVTKGALTVRGIIRTSDEKNYRTVFHNGVRYNDLVSMN
jgi:hypothetical protein